MSWLGLDIGGANLKAADGRGWAQSCRSRCGAIRKGWRLHWPR